MSVRRSRKLPPPGSKRSSVKRRRAAEEAFLAGEGEDEFFAGDDDEKPGKDAGGMDEDVEEAEETAEEARRRKIKEYVARMREAHGADDSDEERGGDTIGELLRQEALQAAGQLQRKLAHRIVLPDLPICADSKPSTSGRVLRGHRKTVTALALTSDGKRVFSVSKDGVVLETDVETGHRTVLDFPDNAARTIPSPGTDPTWVKRGPRVTGRRALLAVAVSWDAHYLAVGGGDHRVHVWDLRSRQYLQGFPGHRDAVSALAFREGTHELYSASFDRSIKLWSLDDMAYVTTLHGHQSEVLALDVLRAERLVSTGLDHTCRVWKVADEVQLVFHAKGMAVDCCRYITPTEWLSGSSDGSLAVWTQTKKRAVSMVRGAHAWPEACRGDDGAVRGAGSVGGDAAAWVQSVAVCRGTDLAASGAGDGVIRLWSVENGQGGAPRTLQPLGGLPARGFVNALAIAPSADLLVAGVGQEPRLGRWGRDAAARNGLLFHRLSLLDD